MGHYMITESNYQDFVKQISDEFPDFKIEMKSNSNLMKTINIFLQVITLGSMKSFMNDFITTIGTTVYVPETWDGQRPVDKLEVLRHERVHMYQAKSHGRILFSLLYVLFPLPLGFSYFRMKFEQEAYEESLRAIHEYYGSRAFTPNLREKFIQHFTTSQYFWMWPWRSSVERWYDRFVATLLLGIEV
jgi:hypothetical protein